VVNWGLEAWKWRALVASEERLSFWNAVKATLAGTGGLRCGYRAPPLPCSGA
jgi:hypothetical protein